MMSSVRVGPWFCLLNLSEGSCWWDWALCRSCLCVELQSPGCNVGCQVPPNVCLLICLKELLLFLGSPKFFYNSVCWVIPSVWAGPWFRLPNLSEGSCCLDWALCRSCLCVELQSPGCTVCCQVPPNVCLQICSKELLLMSNLSVLLLIFLHTEFNSRLYKFRNL